MQLVAVSNLFPFEVVQKIPTLPTLCVTGKLEYGSENLNFGEKKT